MEVVFASTEAVDGINVVAAHGLDVVTAEGLNNVAAEGLDVGAAEGFDVGTAEGLDVVIGSEATDGLTVVCDGLGVVVSESEESTTFAEGDGVEVMFVVVSWFLSSSFNGNGAEAFLPSILSPTKK